MEIDLLIGWLHGNTRKGENEHGPVANETTLGWVLSGPVPTDKIPHLSSINFVSTHILRVAAEALSENSSEELLNQLWDLKSIRIRDKETVHESLRHLAVNHFNHMPPPWWCERRTLTLIILVRTSDSQWVQTEIKSLNLILVTLVISRIGKYYNLCLVQFE